MRILKIIKINRSFIRTLTSGQTPRVRFAPSPTGFLHLGGYRTALVNWLISRKGKGQFILRIEDTDQARLVPQAATQLESELEWLGIPPDESPLKGGPYGPYQQSSRLPIYSTHIQQLIERGSAYECFCTERRIDLLRKEALKLRQKPTYDNKCRHLSRNEVEKNKAEGKPFCIRFKIPKEPKDTQFHDLVEGTMKLHYDPEGDFILIKSDQFPTYHFANIVDDHEMKITHVIRGAEWLVSTPKHLKLYKAFGWNPPQFGHLPLLLNADGTKFSKRQGSLTIASFRERGYYPIALANFMTKHPQNKLENIPSFESLVDSFEIDNLSSYPTKLDWNHLKEFNRHEIHRRLNSPQELPKLIKEIKEMVSNSELSDDYIMKVMNIYKERIDRIPELSNEAFSYIWSIPRTEDILNKFTLPLHVLNTLIEDLKRKPVQLILNELANEFGIKELMRNLRLALSGSEKGPPVAELIVLFGEEMTIARFQNVLNILSQKENDKLKL